MIPVTLVPGHLCGEWLYAPQIDVLKTIADVTIADIGQDSSIGEMADRLLAAAPDRFVVAGLSMGGMVAMEVMARAPERVMGACLWDTDPTPARDREKSWRANNMAKVGTLGLASFLDGFVRSCFAHHADPQAGLGAHVWEKMLETEEDVYFQQSRALDERRAMAPLLSGFQGPVEIVVGEEDKVCPPLLHRPLAEALPNARLTTIPECGHIATLEKPEAATEPLTRLLSAVDMAG